MMATNEYTQGRSSASSSSDDVFLWEGGGWGSVAHSLVSGVHRVVSCGRLIWPLPLKEATHNEPAVSPDLNHTSASAPIEQHIRRWKRREQLHNLPGQGRS